MTSLKFNRNGHSILQFRTVKDSNGHVVDVQQKWSVPIGDPYEIECKGVMPSVKDNEMLVGFSRLEKSPDPKELIMAEYYWVCKSEIHWKSLDSITR